MENINLNKIRKTFQPGINLDIWPKNKKKKMKRKERKRKEKQNVEGG